MANECYDWPGGRIYTENGNQACELDIIENTCVLFVGEDWFEEYQKPNPEIGIQITPQRNMGKERGTRWSREGTKGLEAREPCLEDRDRFHGDGGECLCIVYLVRRYPRGHSITAS